MLIKLYRQNVSLLFNQTCIYIYIYIVISSSPAAFLFVIFHSTESCSSWVNGPSLMSKCLLIILVIDSWVTSGDFPRQFSKCCFHGCIRSCWLIAFSLSLAVLFLLLTSFIVCQRCGRPENSTKYCYDTVMPYIIRILKTDGWRGASFPSLKRAISYNTYVLSSQEIQCPTTQPHKTQNWQHTIRSTQ